MKRDCVAGRRLLKSSMHKITLFEVLDFLKTAREQIREGTNPHAEQAKLRLTANLQWQLNRSKN